MAKKWLLSGSCWHEHVGVMGGKLVVDKPIQLTITTFPH